MTTTVTAPRHTKEGEVDLRAMTPAQARATTPEEAALHAMTPAQARATTPEEAVAQVTASLMAGEPISSQKQKKETVFNRSEKKYLVTHDAANSLINRLGANLIQDERGSTLIRNLYLDTSDYLLIRRSIEKPLYKEKLRVRTYGEIAGAHHEAFVEIKKKLDGQVYKRRLALPLADVEDFARGKIEPQGQIARELAWSFKRYGELQPAISVNYERAAYTYPGFEGNVRITIDCNLKAKFGNKNDFYSPADSPAFQHLLPEGTCVMEIKVLGAIPLELTEILSTLGIYPTSFSKVGTAYKQLCLRADRKGAR